MKWLLGTVNLFILKSLSEYSKHSLTTHSSGKDVKKMNRKEQMDTLRDEQALLPRYGLQTHPSCNSSFAP